MKAERFSTRQYPADYSNDRTLADYSENLLTDILSDEDGPSFHRFQVFAWTLVFGVIFVASVVQTLGMPTFGNTLLGLMGISGGLIWDSSYQGKKRNRSEATRDSNLCLFEL
jgi:hypothetical protein